MKPTRHRQSWFALLAVALLISTAAGETVPALKPIRGGTLRLIQSTDFRSLDPAIAYDGSSVPLVRLLFRGLLEYDDGVNLVPGQAEDWNISPDGKTYTFHLKPGVRFSNGREVEAADYVFSFERILNPATGSPGQGFFTDIAGADEFIAGKTPHVSGLQAPDQRTLIIQLRKPVFTFRYVLAMTFAAAEPRDVVQQYGKDFQYHLVGSGPYRLAEWRRGVRWRLVRNSYYTGPDGYVDAVDIMIGGDAATAIMMLERNEIDWVLAGVPEAIYFEHTPRLRSWVVRTPTVGTDYLFMNTEMKPFDNVLVRRALNYAIDKTRLIRVAGGFGTIANGIVPTAMSWTNDSLPHYDYDPAKARTLLREAGYTNGISITLGFQADNSVMVHQAEGIQQDLQQVGINATLRPVNSSAFGVEVMTRHQVQCGVYGWLQDYPDPGDFLDVLFNGEHITDTDCNNESFYNNPTVNGLLDQAMTSIIEDERIRLFKQAETLIMNDAPWVPLMSEVYPCLYNPRVHGTQPHPVWLWRYEWMWLDPQSQSK